MTYSHLRQSFTLLLAVAAVAFASAVSASQLSLRPAKGMNLVGRVTVDGKPRAGVVVSDGVNVVTTDRKGVYQMSTKGRQHVFVSLPADCELPVEDGFPKIYETIDTLAKGAQQCDFKLKSRTVPARWKLFTMADPQIAPSDTLDYSSTVIPQIRQYVSTLAAPAIYGIALGDLVWNSPQLYPEYKRQTSRIGVPVFSVIGNHDHNENIHNDTDSDRDFRNALGPTYYSVNIGDCHLVVLDDILYSAARGRNDYRGMITPQQMEWLKKDLANVGHDKAILVALHIPTLRRYNGGHIVNNRELYDLLAPYRQSYILSGHVHNNFTTDIAPNIREISFGAAQGAFWYPQCSDGAPRGFAVLEFEGPRLVDKYYMGAGCPRNFQMSLYAPEEASLWDAGRDTPDTDYDKILINVFAWHTDWTIEVSEDGRPFALLPADARLVPSKKLKVRDPGLVKQLVDGRLPANHGSPRPTVWNDHLFLYSPSDKWQTVTVKASDPYGNVYMRSLNRN